MAFPNSVPKGQIPIGCQICETSNRIEWKCETCGYLLCDLCKNNAHAKIGKDHTVKNIKDIGKGPDSARSIQDKGKEPNSARNIKFNLIKTHTVDMENIHHLAVEEDGSIWIGDGQLGVVQYIKLDHLNEKVKTLFTWHTKVFGMALSPRSLYIARGGFSLGISNHATGQILDSKINAKPWVINCVHVTRDHKVIVGAWDCKDKGIVIVMNSEGMHLQKYERDGQKHIFTYPERIAKTSSGNIVVNERYGHMVVILRPGGIVGYYHGHPKINLPDKPFTPMGLLTTPSDNILVVDFATKFLHILNNEGEIITYYNPWNVGITSPYSMGMTASGNIVLGCESGFDHPVGTKAKLHFLTFSGF